MSYLANVVSVGGNGGYPFDFNEIGNGATLKKIQVWVGGSQIKAIKAWLTGQCKEFGQHNGNFSEFLFEDGERFTSLSLWDNTEGNRAGAIKFKTDRSRKFYVQMKDRELKKECPVDVGSGICVGLTGSSGGDTDKLGFKFINTIKSVRLTDVQYPTLNSVKPNVAVEDIDYKIYQNYGDEPCEFIIRASQNIPQKFSWFFAKDNEFAFNMEVKAGIPEVVEVPSGFGFKVETERIYKLENNLEKNDLFTLPLRVSAGRKMDVYITLDKTTVELPYTGKIQFTCSNGGVLEFPTSGTYKGIAYTDIKVVAKEAVNSTSTRP